MSEPEEGPSGPADDAAADGAQRFSEDLQDWLEADHPKTIVGLGEVFGEKSIAVVVALLMFLPALPLPTGGVSHVFEIISLLLALELVIGRTTIWLPKRWQRKELGPSFQGKAIPMIIRRIRWFEKFSRPRLSHLVESRLGRAVAGIAIGGFTLAAFLSPPFSGLDTLPSMGVVVIAIGLILEDAAICIGGTLLGVAGVVVTIGLGSAIVSLF